MNQPLSILIGLIIGTIIFWAGFAIYDKFFNK
jgi:hypothetical protein